MTKPASTTKNPRKQHTPEFSHEALKRAERIGVAAAARSCWYVWHQRRHQINRRQQFCLPVITSSGRHSILALSNVRQFVYGVAAVLFPPPSPRSYFLQIGNTNDYGNRIYPKSARLIFIDRTG